MSRDALLQKIGALKAEAGQVKQFVRIHLPKEGEPVTRATFRCSFDWAGWRRSREREGAISCGAICPQRWPKMA